MEYKWSLNGVAFSCSNARVNHKELCLVSLCLVTVLTHIKLHGVTSQQGKHVTAVRSSDPNRKQTMTPSDLITDSLTVKLLTHTEIRYLNLQSHINQILAEISRTC